MIERDSYTALTDPIETASRTRSKPCNCTG
jgi:hypothetical protein